MEDGSMTDFIFETSSNSHNLGEKRRKKKEGKHNDSLQTSDCSSDFLFLSLSDKETSDSSSDISSDTSSDTMLFKPK
jgi:hypothetical protein